MASTFTLFPLVPRDLRFMIWERTFIPRILSFTYDDERDSDRSEWLDWDAVAVDRLFALPESTIQPDFDLPGPLSGMVTETIAALEVCKESREMALKAGYREWTQIVPSGKMRFYWNPRYDTVSLSEFFDSKRRQPFCVLTDTFCNQFSEQARDLQYISVPTSLWNHPDGEQANGKMAEKLIRFHKLKEIAIMMDNVYEEYRYSYHDHVLLEDNEKEEDLMKGCIFPDDITKGLKEAKASSDNNLFGWGIPKIRLVIDEDCVLSHESLQLKLRCDNVDEWNDFMEKRAAKMRESWESQDWTQHRNSLETLLGAQLFRDRFSGGRFI